MSLRLHDGEVETTLPIKAKADKLLLCGAKEAFTILKHDFIVVGVQAAVARYILESVKDVS